MEGKKEKGEGKKSKWTTFFLILLVLLAVLLLAAILVNELYPKASTKKFVIPVPKSKSKLGKYKNAAIVGGGADCSGVGEKVLRQGGHAVDAAVAVTLCTGVVIPYNLGLSGGHFAVIYNRKESKVYVSDAREQAPAAANKNMYNEEPKKSVYGGMSAAVPGEIKGLWEMHRKFGRLAWKQLFDGAITKAKEGFTVHSHYEYAMTNSLLPYININDTSALHLVLNAETKKILKVGDLVKQPKLAETLQAIAEFGYEEFYGGRTGRNFVKDVQSYGGIITMQDLGRYEVKWREPVTMTFKNNLTFYSAPPPAGGMLPAFILSIMDGFNVTKEDRKTLERYALLEHRMAEAERFAFAHRALLGDPDYSDISEVVENLLSPDYAEDIRKRITDDQTQKVEYYNQKFRNKDDDGTGHITVIDDEGNAVSLTSSINTSFGSKNLSTSTGILIGNTMDDFSVPGHVNYFGLPSAPNNFIEPGKRPQSSMSPSIIVGEDGEVKMVLGAAGGTKIITGVALVSLRHLWQNQGLKESIDEARLHNQLLPNEMVHENGYSEEIIEVLRSKGHTMKNGGQRISVVQAISRNSDGMLFANSDYRKGGFANGY